VGGVSFKFSSVVWLHWAMYWSSLAYGGTDGSVVLVIIGCWGCIIFLLCGFCVFASVIGSV